jgi:hypothetical protein
MGRSLRVDRVSLSYMEPWPHFTQDAWNRHQQAGINGDVYIHSEDELYAVGSELGITGRFARQLCDPVMRALNTLHHLQGMSSMRFADLHALCSPGDRDPIADVCFALVDGSYNPNNICMVGELKTPWTITDRDLNLQQIQSDNSSILERLIGMFKPPRCCF